MPAAGTKSRKHDKGSRVMAKWPKTNLYFQGTILDYNDTEYLVQFEDEDQSELAVKFTHVKNPFNRSSRSRSRGRSPAKKSPSRKSPGRKPSVGRPKTPENLRKKSSPSRKQAQSPSSNKEKRPPRTASADSRTSRPRREVKQVERYGSSSVERNDTKRRIITTTQEKVTTTVVDGKTNNIQVDAKSIAESVQMKNKTVDLLKRGAYCLWTSQKALVLGALLFFLPLFITQVCTKASCTVAQWPSFPNKTKQYFSLEGFGISGGFILVELLLFLIPFGKLIQAREAKFRCNGIFTILASLGVVFPLFHYYQNTTHIFMLHYRQTMVAFMLYSLAIALLLYVKSFFARKDSLNPSANTGYYLHDFVHGRELNPTVLKFDIQSFMFRCGVHSWILVSILFAAKEFRDHPDNYSAPLMLTAFLLVIYGFDQLWFEDYFLSTFEYKKVGVGLITSATYFSFPFHAAVYFRFHLGHRVEMPWYCLAPIVILSLVGLAFQRAAHSVKHTYRSNPAHPAVATLETLPTAAGTRLIVSGWWGIVRHPNYLGNIISIVAWSLLCGIHYPFPWLLCAFNVLYLVGRVFIVEKECKKKYGLAWGSYCARVPRRLIPGLF